MSCISSNFSSFFLNSLNDPSEFSKYLSNGELRFSSTFEDFQVYGQNPQQQQQHHMNGSVGMLHANGELDDGNSNIENTQPMITASVHQYGNYQAQQQQMHPHLQQQRWVSSGNPNQQQQMLIANPQQTLHQHPAVGSTTAAPVGPTSATVTGTQHFDGSFEFMKYLRHSNDYNDNTHEGQNSSASNSSIALGTKPEASLNAANASLMDLDNAHKRSASRKTPTLSSANNNHSSSSSVTNNSHPTPMAIDMYDHDSKHTMYDFHHMNSVQSSNSNESSMELSSMTYPNSHLNASNSNTSSEGGTNPAHNDFSMLSVASSQNSSSVAAAAAAASAAAASPAAPKPLASFTIKDNFDAHPSHKVEEGIFQHMNKLPPKKKDNLKQLGVRFTGQMTLNDKSIIVENFVKFCHEYDIKDHRPFLSLNQSGLNKPDQIKFARYLGQGLPTFTLFCIYSNFKNLFCTKRTEVYTKEGYNLPYILDKTKRFLANTTAGNNNNNASNTLSSTSTTMATATAASASITNSLNSNTTTNNTTTTTTTNNNPSTNGNANNAATANVPAAMQNGSNGNVNGNGTINNDIVNTPTKHIHNVPSPATPRTPQIQQQQMPQIPMQTQNTPLPAHPPHPHPNHIMAIHPSATPQTLNNTHVQHQHHPPHLLQQQQLQQQHHHHIQMPMSPRVAVTSSTPSTSMGSPLPPAASSAVVLTQSTTNHHQHPLQHPHHMQPNNHLPLHHPPSLSHHVHPTTPSIQQHPDHVAAAAVIAYQQHHHQQQQQNHHPLHNLAAQNPPL